MSTDKQPTPTPEGLAAALALAESKSWLTDEKCFAALDTLDHMVPRNSDDALEVHEEVNGILASAYRAQAAEVERLKAIIKAHETAVTVGEKARRKIELPNGEPDNSDAAVWERATAYWCTTANDLQAQLAREKARADELQLCLGATEAQVKSLEASVLDLQQQLAALTPAQPADARCIHIGQGDVEMGAIRCKNGLWGFLFQQHDKQHSIGEKAANDGEEYTPNSRDFVVWVHKPESAVVLLEQVQQLVKRMGAAQPAMLAARKGQP